MAGRRISRVGLGVVLLGFGWGYAAGVVGPAAAPISHEFGVSLGAAGLMTSVFFVAITAYTLFGPAFEERIGIPWSARIGAVLMGVGGVIAAVSPGFAGVLGGRAVAGLGTAIAVITAPVIARALKSVLLLGVYGSGITLGLAAALFVGGQLSEAGVDWRINFGISAGIGLSALPFLFGLPVVEPARRVGAAGLRKLFMSWTFWRADLLFIFVNSVPIMLGAWLFHYLTIHHGLGAGVAGAFGFVIFGVQAAARPFGGKLAVSPSRRLVLAVAGPALATVGILALALDRHESVAAIAIVVAGLGFGLPYALAYQRIEDSIEGNPALGLAVGIQGVTVAAIVVVPLIGAALDDGYGRLAFVLLAAFCAAAALANVTRRAG